MGLSLIRAGIHSAFLCICGKIVQKAKKKKGGVESAAELQVITRVTALLFVFEDSWKTAALPQETCAACPVHHTVVPVITSWKH